MAEVKLSSKNQIVVPREAREAREAKPGDRLLVVVRGKTVILMNRPEKHSRAIRGLALERYPKRYLEKERKSWE
jgi:AbrB family looped-hinge helix DNA binding protein